MVSGTCCFFYRLWMILSSPPLIGYICISEYIKAILKIKGFLHLLISEEGSSPFFMFPERGGNFCCLRGRVMNGKNTSVLFHFTTILVSPCEGKNDFSDWWHWEEKKNQLTCLSPFKIFYHFVKGWSLRTQIFSADQSHNLIRVCQGAPLWSMLQPHYQLNLIHSRDGICPSSNLFQTQELGSLQP